MFNSADVILAEVCENTGIKGEAVNTVVTESDGANLHDAVFTALFYHESHELLDFVAFGGCVVCLDELVANHNSDCADNANLVTLGFENRLNHARCGCLSLCARDADCFELFSRVTVKFG